MNIFAAFIAVGLGLALAFSLFQKQREHESAQYSAEELQRTQDARAAFAKLSPSEALAQCRQSWEAALPLSHYYLPQALAWSRLGIDGYYLQGVDTSSLRHFHCDADGTVMRGKRYLRPGMASIPAESTLQKSDEAAPDPIKNALAEQKLSSDLVALELYLAPDQSITVRRWQGAEQLESAVEPPGATLPLLLQSPSPTMQVEAQLQALPAHNWLHDPGAALALLAAQLPVGAKVMKIRLDEDEINVTIEGPIPAFDKDPPAPSGDMEYDEYGIADLSWWYPRPVFSGECGRGEILATVVQEFDAQYDAQTNYPWLAYDCAKGWQMIRPEQ